MAGTVQTIKHAHGRYAAYTIYYPFHADSKLFEAVPL
jgi:hypothetical protein